MGLFDFFRRTENVQIQAAVPHSIPVPYDGQKFPGGLLSILSEIDTLDYLALRRRSASMFHGNGYARGIIRRFVTNVINTGLNAESIPEESILGLQEDSLINWSEDIENRFGLYADSADIIDIKGTRNFGALQRQIYTEALVGGDCVVIIRQHPEYKLPQLQIIPGDAIATPPSRMMDKSVVHGVEVDNNGKHLAYFVDLGEGHPLEKRFQRIACKGDKTGREQAFMVYGIDRREGSTRGEPLLAIAIQPLKEIDKYRDAVQRKALINSMIAGFIERSNDKPASLPIQSGGAKRVTTMTAGGDGAKPMTFAEVLPGVFMERLQPGEKPVPYSNSGTDLNFGPFEAAILQGLAWALECPPEVLQLSFEKNYSASQAANNEWWIKVRMERSRLGAEACDPVFREWFLSSVLLGKIEAAGYLEDYKNPLNYDRARAWANVDWTGAIKPSVDPVKLGTGYQLLVSEGWMDNARAARELTGTKFSKNIRRIKAENEMKKAAGLVPLKVETFGQEADQQDEPNKDQEDEQ